MRREYDINEFYENFMEMSEQEKLHNLQESGDASMPESEKNVVLSRIAGQLGINDASKLPYAAGLAQAR